MQLDKVRYNSLYTAIDKGSKEYEKYLKKNLKGQERIIYNILAGVDFIIKNYDDISFVSKLQQMLKGKFEEWLPVYIESELYNKPRENRTTVEYNNDILDNFQTNSNTGNVSYI